MRRKRQNESSSNSSSNNNAPLQEDEFLQQVQTLIPAEVRMISGCHSEQTSADVTATVDGPSSASLPNPLGKSGGACTRALLDILHQHAPGESNVTFQQLLLELRASLSYDGFDQVPQLTSTRPLEMEETPFSMVSNDPQGRRRALLVGINYLGQSGELKGCHNDALQMKEYLVEKQGYLKRDVILLLDDGNHHQPTKLNIITVLQQLVLQSQAGDSIVFHYSGHGGLLESHACSNLWKQAANDYDEFLYPLDHHPNQGESSNPNIIRDFSLFNNFVKPLKQGVTVTCIMDCCHSGSVLDLPFSYKPSSSGSIIVSERRIEHLYNLAFLYLLAGGVFPSGDLFTGIAGALEGVTGQSVSSLQGSGMDGEEGFLGDGSPSYHEENISVDAVDQLDSDGDLGDDGHAGVSGLEQNSSTRHSVGRESDRTGDIPQPLVSESKGPTIDDNPISASDAAGSSTFDIRNSADLGSGDYTAMGSIAMTTFVGSEEDAAFSADEDVDCGCLGDLLQNLASDE